MAPLPAMAQVIRGNITDVETRAAIRGVNVHLVSQNGRTIYTVLSDSAGNFELVVPFARPVFVQTELIGYEIATSAALMVNRGELVAVDVLLSPRAVELTGVDVVARKPADPRLREFMERAALGNRAGLGRIWTRADLDKRPYTLISHLLRTIPTRPSGPCGAPAVFVDDLPIMDDPFRVAEGWSDKMADVDLLVAPEDLEGVEVYRDFEIPGTYLGRTLKADGSQPCLLVLLWRKSYGEHRVHWSWGSFFTALGLTALSTVSTIYFR